MQSANASSTGNSVRPLRNPLSYWGGRDGTSVQSSRHPAGPHGGYQGPDRSAGQTRTDTTLRTRGARNRGAESSHICTLYDIGRHEGIDYLVMEYVDGETLAAHLARNPLHE